MSACNILALGSQNPCRFLFLLGVQRGKAALVARWQCEIHPELTVAGCVQAGRGVTGTPLFLRAAHRIAHLLVKHGRAAARPVNARYRRGLKHEYSGKGSVVIFGKKRRC